MTLPQPKGAIYTIPVSTGPSGATYSGSPAPALPFGADYAAITYAGSFVATLVYKTGGAGGTTIATLTFANDGTNITSITQS